MYQPQQYQTYQPHPGVYQGYANYQGGGGNFQGGYNSQVGNQRQGPMLEIQGRNSNIMIVCYRCGEAGHKSDRFNADPGMLCGSCGRVGHNSQACAIFRAPAANQRPRVQP